MSNPLPTTAGNESPLPTADDLAIMLGLREGPSPFVTRAWAHEGERNDDLAIFVGRFSKQPILKNAIFAEFGAKYLPETVNRFVEAKFELPPPPSPPLAVFKIYNSYFEAMFGVLRLHFSYFAKYLRSKRSIALQGKILARVFAERLAEMAPLLYKGTIIDPNHEESLGCVLGVLMLMLDVFADDQEPIPADVNITLLVFLQACKKSQDENVRANGETLSSLLTVGHPNFSSERINFIRMTRGRNKCGLPGCEMTTNLRTCAGCKTICYCSPEHQRTHWSSKTSPPHKTYCYPTMY
ncbi:hypothetical protein BDN72DRAFT_837046 [Pluteus cervinus]|uniref:Uncharacterized protein n=1 Tax=Pluteus cervinus TaxID=181527 RepID=A0ACD3B280_9AGAR|nr:hypothetical protein BDN72DRAFT_837046 [Pluteus cervinus]